MTSIQEVFNSICNRIKYFNNHINSLLLDCDYRKDFETICFLARQIPNLTPEIKSFINLDIDEVINFIVQEHIKLFNHKIGICAANSDADEKKVVCFAGMKPSVDPLCSGYNYKKKFEEICFLAKQSHNPTQEIQDFISQDINKIIEETNQRRILKEQENKLKAQQYQQLILCLEAIKKLPHILSDIDYIPRYSKHSTQQTQTMLYYKSYAEQVYKRTQEAFCEMNKIMFSSLEKLINKINQVSDESFRIILCVCPSSSPNKQNTVSLSVREFIKTHAYKNVSDCSKLFVRKNAIPPSHLSKHRSISQHLDSIRVNNEYNLNFSDRKNIFIICDDIRSSGKTTNACKSLLNYRFVPDENIFIYTIAQTKMVDL